MNQTVKVHKNFQLLQNYAMSQIASVGKALKMAQSFVASQLVLIGKQLKITDLLSLLEDLFVNTGLELPLNVKAGSFVKSTTDTGYPFDVATTGIGFRPKAVIMYYGGSNSNPTDLTRPAIGMAVADDEQVGVGYSATDNAAQTSTSRIFSDVSLITQITFSVHAVEAALKSFDADGWTMTYLANQTSAHDFAYLAIGGSDISNVKIVTFNAPTSTGDQDVTTIGFQPDVLIFLYSNVAGNALTADACFGMGMATGSSEQGAWCMASRDAEATATVAKRYQRTNQCIVLLDPDAPGTVDGEASFVSFLSNGFRINWGNAPANAHPIGVLAIKGGKWKVGAETMKITSTGTKTTTVGFTPKALLMTGFGDVAQSTVQAHARMHIGFATGATEERGAWNGEEDAVATTITARAYATARCIQLRDEVATGTSSAIITDAEFSAFNVADFVLNYLTVDANAYQFLYLAGGYDTRKFVSQVFAGTQVVRAGKGLKMLQSFAGAQVVRVGKGLRILQTFVGTQLVKTPTRDLKSLQTFAMAQIVRAGKGLKLAQAFSGVQVARVDKGFKMLQAYTMSQLSRVGKGLKLAQAFVFSNIAISGKGLKLSETLMYVDHGLSMLFDNPSSQYVSVGDRSLLSFVDNIFALSFWAKFDDWDTTLHGILGKRGTSNWEYSVHVNTIGTLQFQAWNAAGSTVYTTNTTSVDTNWHHWLWSADGTDARLYKDGVLLTTVAKTANNMADTTSAFEIGRGGSASGLRYMKGKLDDVRIFTDDRDATDAEALAGGGNITSGLVGHWKFDEGRGTIVKDHSGNGYDGTLQNSPVWNYDVPVQVGTTKVGKVLKLLQSYVMSQLVKTHKDLKLLQSYSHTFLVTVGKEIKLLQSYSMSQLARVGKELRLLQGYSMAQAVFRSKPVNVTDAFAGAQVVRVGKALKLVQSFTMSQLTRVDKAFKLLQNLVFSFVVTAINEGSGIIEKFVSEIFAMSDTARINKTLKFLQALIYADTIKANKNLILSQIFSMAHNQFTDKALQISQAFTASQNVLINKTLKLIQMFTNVDVTLVGRAIKMLQTYAMAQTAKVGKQFKLLQNYVMSEVALVSKPIKILQTYTMLQLSRVDKELRLAQAYLHSDIALVSKPITLLQSFVNNSVVRVDKGLKLLQALSYSDVLYRSKQIIIAQLYSMNHNVFVHKTFKLLQAIAFADVSFRSMAIQLVQSFIASDVMKVGKSLKLAQSFVSVQAIIASKNFILSQMFSGAEVVRVNKALILAQIYSMAQSVSVSKVLKILQNYVMSQIARVNKEFKLSQSLSLGTVAFVGKMLKVLQSFTNVDVVRVGKGLKLAQNYSMSQLVLAHKGIKLLQAYAHSFVVTVNETLQAIFVSEIFNIANVARVGKSLKFAQAVAFAQQVSRGKIILLNQLLSLSHSILVHKGIKVLQSYSLVQLARAHKGIKVVQSFVGTAVAIVVDLGIIVIPQFVTQMFTMSQSVMVNKNLKILQLFVMTVSVNKAKLVWHRITRMLKKVFRTQMMPVKHTVMQGQKSFKTQMPQKNFVAVMPKQTFSTSTKQG